MGKHGVALVITTELGNRIEDFKPISNKMVHVTINFGRKKSSS